MGSLFAAPLTNLQTDQFARLYVELFFLRKLPFVEPSTTQSFTPCGIFAFLFTEFVQLDGFVHVSGEGAFWMENSWFFYLYPEHVLFPPVMEITNAPLVVGYPEPFHAPGVQAFLNSGQT